jgi:hypothetical protein
MYEIHTNYQTTYQEIPRNLQRTTTDIPDDRTTYKTAIQTTLISPPVAPLARPILAHQADMQKFFKAEAEVKADPWGLITQRLYAWALVWEENMFIKAMEEISLNKQVSTRQSACNY